MAASIQIPFRSRQTITCQKWVCAALGIIMLAFILYYSFSSERIRSVASLWIIFGPLVLYALSGYQLSASLECILGEKDNEERIAQYKSLLSKNFAEACLNLEDRAEIVSQDKVAMASPLTWGRKQGRKVFWEEPFQITIIENNGRVGTLRVNYLPNGL